MISLNNLNLSSGLTNALGKFWAGILAIADGVFSPSEFNWAVEMALIIEESVVADKNDLIESVLFKLAAIY